MNTRVICAFGAMNEIFSQEDRCATSINDQRAVVNMYVPLGTEGIGFMPVNDVAVETSIIGNTLMLRINQPHQAMIFDFTGVWGNCRFRLCRYYWRLEAQVDQEVQPGDGVLRTPIGDLTLGLSDALAQLTYTPFEGVPERIEDGAEISINQGSLNCVGAITGLYQLDFYGLWGPGVVPLSSPHINNPAAELPEPEELPDQLRAVYTRFCTQLTGRQILPRGALHRALENEDSLRLVELVRITLAHW